MSIATTRTQVELEIEAANRAAERACKRLGLDKLNLDYIADGAWQMKGRDGKWRDVKIKKGKKAKVDKRHNMGMRDTAKPEIAAVGKPGTESRIAAMAAYYQNPLNEGVSAFERSDSDIADALAGVLAAKVCNASYDVDAIDEFVPEE